MTVANTRNISESALKDLAFKAAMIIVGSVLMTIAAKYQVPFYPIPMSLQTLVAIGIGLAFGPIMGAATVLFYIAQGAIGLPVFANSPERGIGLVYLMGPTGGYLIGLILSAFISGALSRGLAARRFVPVLAIALLAGAVVYVPGLLWLGHFVGYNGTLLKAGLFPFVLGDLLKAIVAALIFVQGRHVLSRRKRTGS